MGSHYEAIHDMEIQEAKSNKLEVGTCSVCGHYNDPANSTCNCANKTLRRDAGSALFGDPVEVSDEIAEAIAESKRITVDSLLGPDSVAPTPINNGGSTDYYKFDPSWCECADIIEARNHNYNQGNIFKAAFCFNTDRHSGTNEVRELNKIIYFAQRQLNLLEETNEY